MSEIPEDILTAAENALDKLLCNCREAGDVRQDSILDIARAILAERERCDRIAEMAADVETETVWNAATKYILRRIRNPHSLPTATDSPAGVTPSPSLPGSQSQTGAP